MFSGVHTRNDGPVNEPNRPGNGLGVASDGNDAATAAATSADGDNG